MEPYSRDRAQQDVRNFIRSEIVFKKNNDAMLRKALKGSSNIQSVSAYLNGFNPFFNSLELNAS